MLTKQNYIAIAAIVADSRPFDEGVIKVVGGLADYFATDNPAFDRDVFMAACTGGKLKPRRRKTTVKGSITASGVRLSGKIA